jgi:hypothetical protein
MTPATTSPADTVGVGFGGLLLLPPPLIPLTFPTPVSGRRVGVGVVAGVEAGVEASVRVDAGVAVSVEARVDEGVEAGVIEAAGGGDTDIWGVGALVTEGLAGGGDIDIRAVGVLLPEGLEEGAADRDADIRTDGVVLTEGLEEGGTDGDMRTGYGLGQSSAAHTPDDGVPPVDPAFCTHRV